MRGSGRPHISGPFPPGQNPTGPPQNHPNHPVNMQPGRGRGVGSPMRGGPPMRGMPMRGRGGFPPRGRGRGGFGSHPSRSTHLSARSGYTNKTSGGACPGCDCSFNLKYCTSLQGLCKALQICSLLVTWAVIASSPYWRRYFVIGGVTWPFHLVMLITISTWICCSCLYILFLLGWHFSYRSINWPGVELWYNVSALVGMIAAGTLQSVHVWRWDYRNGLPLQSQMPAQAMGGNRGNFFGGGIGNLGLSGGLGSSNFCGGAQGSPSTQRDCMELLQAMAGINQYYGHHIFAAIFLWIIVCEFMVSLWLAYRTYRKFNERYFSDTQSQREPGMSVYDEEPTCGSCSSLCEETTNAFKQNVGSIRNSTRRLINRDTAEQDTLKGSVFDSQSMDSGKGRSRSRSRSRDRVQRIHHQQARSTEQFSGHPPPQQHSRQPSYNSPNRREDYMERPPSRPSMVV